MRGLASKNSHINPTAGQWGRAGVTNHNLGPAALKCQRRSAETPLRPNAATFRQSAAPITQRPKQVFNSLLGFRFQEPAWGADAEEARRDSDARPLRPGRRRRRNRPRQGDRTRWRCPRVSERSCRELRGRTRAIRCRQVRVVPGSWTRRRFPPRNVCFWRFSGPIEDLAVALASGQLFLQGFRVDAGEFQESLVHRAGVVVLAGFAGHGGAALVEYAGQNDKSTKPHSRAAGRKFG